MIPFTIEATVSPDGSVTLPAVPFAPGTKLVVTVEEAEPMDREAFEAELKRHYEQASRSEPDRPS